MTWPQSPPDDAGPPTAEALTRAFDSPAALTVGAEEELMLLDPASRDLAPVARDGMEPAGGDPRFKLELPASQLEIISAPASTAGEVTRELRESRRALAGLTRGVA